LREPISATRDTGLVTDGGDAEIEIPGRVTLMGQVTPAVDLIGDAQAAVIRAVPVPEVASRHIVGVCLDKARFVNVDLSGASFHDAALSGISIWAWGPNLTSGIKDMTINGVEIQPLLDAELDRRFPERLVLRNINDVPSMVTGLQALETMWAPTIEHAATLDPSLLDEKIGDGLSFLETLRHLVFGFDAWVRRTALGHNNPYHSCGLAYPDTSGTWSPSGPVPWSAVGIDIHARPVLDEILAARLENTELALRLLSEMSDNEIRAVPPPSDAPGYPGPREPRSLWAALKGQINEEWWHHQYAIRDLAAIENRPG
jgi:hypothetical protein